MRLKLPSAARQENQQVLQRSLAIEDCALLGAAALIDLDHIMDTGRRGDAIELLAIACERYCLEPDTLASILHELHPGLKDIMPPPPGDGHTKVIS